MNEVDYDKLLKTEFEKQSIEQCLYVAQRAALRDFLDVSLYSNTDPSERVIFPRGRILLQAVVHSHFQCNESREALGRSLNSAKQVDRLLFETTTHLVAEATYHQKKQKALAVVSALATAFASGANREQFLQAKSVADFQSPNAYFGTKRTILKNCLADFNTNQPELFAAPLWSEKPANSPLSLERGDYVKFYKDRNFSFWCDWYRGYLDGKPLDWEIQRQVALIDESLWNTGPDAVAKQIEEIRARRHVETTLADLKDSFKSAELGTAWHRRQQPTQG